MVYPLELFGNRNIMILFSFFIENPSIEISQSDIIKRIKFAKGTAVKWLALLVSENFLLCKTIGATNIYKLNNENIMVRELKILNTLLQIKDICRLNSMCIELYLYGSCARGDNMEESDIDILIIGNLKRDAIINDIEKISNKINKKINFQVFSSLDWAMLEKKDNVFYERVEKDKLRLL